MTLTLFSPEWAQALCVAINADERYREAAARWEWPVALVVQADANVPEDMAVELALRAGRCEGARTVPAVEATAPFVLRGDRAAWLCILARELDPIAAIVRRELTLARGSLGTLMLHVAAARALVEAARTVATEP